MSRATTTTATTTTTMIAVVLTLTARHALAKRIATRQGGQACAAFYGRCRVWRGVAGRPGRGQRIPLAPGAGALIQVSASVPEQGPGVGIGLLIVLDGDLAV